MTEDRNVGVGCGLEKSQPKRDDIERNQEKAVALDLGSRIEEQCADGVEEKAYDDGSLVSGTANHQAGGKCGTEIADIERQLDEARLRAGERQCLLKLADQDVIERRSESPCKEQRGHNSEGQQIAPVHYRRAPSVARRLCVWGCCQIYVSIARQSADVIGQFGLAFLEFIRPGAKAPIPCPSAIIPIKYTFTSKIIRDL
jgi:hypothetical protein